MSETVTEEHVLDALSRYGDAIEESVAVAPPDHGENSVATPSEPASNRGITFESPDVIDVEPTRRNNQLVAVGALLIATFAVIAGVFAFGVGPAAVDTAPVDSQSVPTGFNDDSIGGPDIIGFGENGTTVYDNGEFVSIGRDATGLIIARSTDGTTWTTTPVTDAPEGASPAELTRTDDGWVVVFEVWPGADLATNRFFSNGEPVERLLGTSTDLLKWDTAALPQFTEFAAAQSFVAGIAVSDARVAVLGVASIGGGQEREILLSSGVVSEAELDNYCGSYEFVSNEFVAYTCDVEEQMFDVVDGNDAGSSSETAARAATLAQFELFRVAPGEAGYVQLSQLRDFGWSGFGFAPVVLAGPLDGPFELSQPDMGDFNFGIIGSEAGFVAAGSTDADIPVLVTSTNGVTWSEPESIRDSFFLIDLGMSDAGLTAVGQQAGAGSVAVLVSEDNGQAWSESVVPTSLQFLETGIGPGGVVVSAIGPLVGEYVVEKDGFTMVVEFETFDAGLVGPDGETIYEVGAAHVLGFGTQNPEGVVRYDGELGEADMVWLDPTTGEDLVRFTIDEAAQSADGEAAVAQIEIWFTADGLDWQLLESSQRDVAASTLLLAEDGVLLRSRNNPPEELLAFQAGGYEPTSGETAALEAWFEGDAVTWEWIPVE